MKPASYCIARESKEEDQEVLHYQGKVCSNDRNDGVVSEYVNENGDHYACQFPNEKFLKQYVSKISI